VEGFESVIYWDLNSGGHDLVEGSGTMNGGVRLKLGLETSRDAPGGIGLYEIPEVSKDRARREKRDETRRERRDKRRMLPKGVLAERKTRRERGVQKRALERDLMIRWLQVEERGRWGAVRTYTSSAPDADRGMARHD